jgi:hypothetical protein
MNTTKKEKTRKKDMHGKKQGQTHAKAPALGGE